MDILKERILKEGKVKQGNVLKVDSFINHQMDIKLFNQMGQEFKRIFSDVKVEKIFTIEASGIGIAAIVAQYFDVPVIFAKKTESKNLDGDILTSRVESFTRGKTYNIMVEKKFVKEGEKILLIDDFLAKGKAILGLTDIVKKGGAEVVGAGIVIEKGFQEGGDMLRKDGIRVESLAIIDKMEDGKIYFRD